ncbi:MAG: cell division protein SepF, partial [Candidatus Thorarchaeota archaeon]
LFKRVRKTDASDESTVQRTLPSLGLFAPVSESRKTDPHHDIKRLAELEQIFIRTRKLESLADVPEIVGEIRNGNIVLLDISRLNDGNDQTHLELKRIIERIRGETRGYQAEIALVNDGCMIVTPSFVSF